MWNINNPERASYHEWRQFALKVKELEKRFKWALLNNKFAGKEDSRKKIEDNLMKMTQEVEDYREQGWSTKTMV